MKIIKKVAQISIVVSLMILSMLIASAGLFSFSSTTTVDAKQSVVIDGKSWSEKIYHKVSLYGGCSYYFTHTITNRGCKDIKLSWTITGTPDLEGVKVSIGTYKKWNLHNRHYPSIGCVECGDSGLLVPLSSPFCLKAGQTITVCFRYQLDMLIKPGVYVINAILVPGGQ